MTYRKSLAVGDSCLVLSDSGRTIRLMTTTADDARQMAADTTRSYRGFRRMAVVRVTKVGSKVMRRLDDLKP